MAEKNEYTIILKSDGGRNSESPIAGDKSDSGRSGGLLSKEGAKTFMKGMVAYGTAKSFVVPAINHEVSLVQLRTGSNELQERANFISDVVQKGVSATESIGVGILAGGLPGAGIGLVVSIAHTLIGYSQKQERLNLERNLENESLRRNIVRAGASNSRANQI